MVAGKNLSKWALQTAQQSSTATANQRAITGQGKHEQMLWWVKKIVTDTAYRLLESLADTWAKISIQMVDSCNSANGNPHRYEMVSMANGETEGEEMLAKNVPSKSCRSDATGSVAVSVMKLVPNFHGLKFCLWRSLGVVFFQNKSNLLLLFGPAAAVASWWNINKGLVFLFSLIGLAPLAERLGFLTEELSFYTGATVGGLLNATFGNATELIISLHALRNDMIHVVKQSLLGSILSNMLLVLGSAFLCGGIKNKKIQSFNKATATVNSGLLLMAVMGLLFPTVLHFTHTEIHTGQSQMALSRFSSCIMLIAYSSYLFFQLKYDQAMHGHEEEIRHGGDTSEENEPAKLTFSEAILWLAIITVFISFLSGYLVNALEGASKSWNMPLSFISVILLPIVGNAAEHSSAIIFSMKDEVDLSVGVAIGSSTQISMFLIPFCVVVGWIMNKPMDLNFQLFETGTLFMTVLVVAFMLQEGKSNYFKGLMLVLCYLIVGASFFVHDDHETANKY